MTPAEHVKAIEDAAEQYAYAYSIDDFKDRSKAFDVLQDAIWAGVRVDHSVDANKKVAAPEWLPIAAAPKDGSDVLLRSHDKHLADGYWLTGAYNGNGAWIWPYVNRTPQYWMPIPAAPKP